MSEDKDWEETKHRIKLGSRLQGVVIEHKPFGIFVDIGDPVAIGLVQIIDFRDEAPMIADDYPALGSIVEAIIIGFTDARRKQVWMTMKPSWLSRNDAEILALMQNSHRGLRN